MCDELKKAQHKRVRAAKMRKSHSQLIAASTTANDLSHDDKKHGLNDCVQSDVIRMQTINVALLVEDRAEALEDQAIEHEEKSRERRRHQAIDEELEKRGQFAKMMGKIAESYPIIIILALFLSADKLIPIISGMVSK